MVKKPKTQNLKGQKANKLKNVQGPFKSHLPKQKQGLEEALDK